ncbi:MAG: ATP-binding cassette domain-containing protein [Sphaerochaetaceae bacterium]|nr:ATP-binding cassette domain-containing protein [Spirochaetales bacterium]MBQ3728540.1 ATP-binding cassette domain-containing protein [Spirochaetales bacterium]MCR5443855.1 ATP-binding cassette domain-containing protein [Sphaerochaetaceae bacterium]
MENNENKKVLLSLKDVEVKFNVRGRILTAIRRVSLDIYENESIAIVGESGSGKSVLTKTFAGMLDSNGFISNGSIIFSDDSLSKTTVQIDAKRQKYLDKMINTLNEYSVLERGAAEYVAIEQKKMEIRHSQGLTPEEESDFAIRIKNLDDDIVDRTNYVVALDRRNAQDAVEIQEISQKIKAWKDQIKAIRKERTDLIAKRAAEYKANAERRAADEKVIADLEARRAEKIAKEDQPGNPFGLTDKVLERNVLIAREILLSIGRYPLRSQVVFTRKLKKAFKLAMSIGEDLDRSAVKNRLFETCTFRVAFRGYDEATKTLIGYAIIDCAKVKYTKDWQQIRGCRIATVFQDPMTSLNPVLTIGKQISTVIIKHQKCSQEEAKKRTLDIMAKVGIPEPEKRYDDYPFMYSGGMRQRIVIAIALSCQPKILICDEPTTALDVTIQAQIIRLIKDLQHQLGYTTVYITHDLGVVANVAERVAVLYGGQIVELGTVEDIFYEPKHPYTWALLSSLTQLAEKGDDLFSIPGTPPSLYNKIIGDAFAPRNAYAMAIDRVKEPPMFQINDHHWAKTWLLDPRAPEVEPPKIIQNLHEKMLKSYVNVEG